MVIQVNSGKKYVVDCRHLKSPKPLMIVRDKLEKLSKGDQLQILITDPQCEEVIPLYMDSLGHKLIRKEKLYENDYECIILEFIID
jgi:TusA-related sulfurtransferase